MSKRTTKKKLRSHKTDVSSVEDLLSLVNKDLGEAIVSILGERPNNSCKKETMTSLMCQYYNIITHGNPRIKIQRKVNGAITYLKKKKFIREYKAKNIRIQLTPTRKSLLPKSVQMELPFNIVETQAREIREASVDNNDGLFLRALELLKKE